MKLKFGVFRDELGDVIKSVNGVHWELNLDATGFVGVHEAECCSEWEEERFDDAASLGSSLARILVNDWMK